MIRNLFLAIFLFIHFNALAIHDLCAKGDYSGVLKLLGEKKSQLEDTYNLMNELDKDGHSPLYYACNGKNLFIRNEDVDRDGQMKIIKLLAMAGADPNFNYSNEGKKFFSPLHSIIRNEDLIILKIFLKAFRFKVDINLKNDADETPLYVAASFFNEKIVDKLLKIPGIDPTAKNNEGYTPLDAGLKIDNKIAKYLMDKYIEIGLGALKGTSNIYYPELTVHQIKYLIKNDKTIDLLNEEIAEAQEAIGADKTYKTNCKTIKKIYDHLIFLIKNNDDLSSLSDIFIAKQNIPDDIIKAIIYTAIKYGNEKALNLLFNYDKILSDNNKNYSSYIAHALIYDKIGNIIEFFLKKMGLCREDPDHITWNKVLSIIKDSKNYSPFKFIYDLTKNYNIEIDYNIFNLFEYNLFALRKYKDINISKYSHIYLKNGYYDVITNKLNLCRDKEELIYSAIKNKDEVFFDYLILKFGKYFFVPYILKKDLKEEDFQFLNSKNLWQDMDLHILFSRDNFFQAGSQVIETFLKQMNIMNWSFFEFNFKDHLYGFIEYNKIDPNLWQGLLDRLPDGVFKLQNDKSPAKFMVRYMPDVEQLKSIKDLDIRNKIIKLKCLENLKYISKIDINYIKNLQEFDIDFLDSDLLNQSLKNDIKTFCQDPFNYNNRDLARSLLDSFGPEIKKIDIREILDLAIHDYEIQGDRMILTKLIKLFYKRIDEEKLSIIHELAKNKNDEDLLGIISKNKKSKKRKRSPNLYEENEDDKKRQKKNMS